MVGIVEVHVVEHVESLGAKLHGASLGDSRVLDQTHIGAANTWALENIVIGVNAELDLGYKGETRTDTDCNPSLPHTHQGRVALRRADSHLNRVIASPKVRYLEIDLDETHKARSHTCKQYFRGHPANGYRGRKRFS